MVQKTLIAHRGNINGRFAYYENRPDYIIETLSQGFDAEIDVWHINGAFFLGHDNPQYEIRYEFLLTKGLWIHCKDVDSLCVLSDKGLNAFAHKDDIIITPNGYLWTAPSFPITERSIAVMPELDTRWDISKACGICSDHIIDYK